MSKARRILGILVAMGLMTLTLGFADRSADAPGDQVLVNFQHIFNAPSAGADPTAQGTDVEFFTNVVPKRDYVTGIVERDANGNVITWERDFAVLGSYGGGAYVYDITNPEATQFAKRIPCNQTQNDVQIKQFGTKWVLALARDGSGNPCVSPQKGTGSGGIALFDITDPYVPAGMYSFRVTGAAHNFTFHPTKPFGWVSTGDLPGAAAQDNIPIIDFTNINAPVLAATIDTTGGSAHDIVFSPDGLRAFVANENTNRIFNTTDPKAPTQVSVIPNDGTYAHGLDPTPNRKLMIGTNESLALGGFFTGSGVCPGEGLTFYNIDGALEQAPVPVGYFEANVQGVTPSGWACTGHVGKVANNNHVVVTAWYIGGVRVVDFTNPSLPVEVGSAVMNNAQGVTEAWSAKFYKGPYVYVGDERRGFDVFKWTGTSIAPWLAP